MPGTGKNIPLVKADDPITAADENAVRSQVNSLSAVSDESGNIGGLKGSFPEKAIVDPDHILIKNNTIADITVIRPVMALGTPLKSAEDSNGHAFRVPVLNGEEPADGDEGKFAVLYGKVDTGGLREAVVSGTTWVRVLVNDSTDGYADIEIGDSTRLQTATSGSAQIIYLGADEVGGEDERWAFVRLSNSGTGGGTKIVGFQITSIDRANRTAIVQITSKPIDGVVPGSGLGGTIIDSVCDVNGQWLNDASRIYIGDFGYAVYLDPGGATFCDEYNDGPHWEMLSLSCDGAECFDDV